jgi:hypothetical protein
MQFEGPVEGYVVNFLAKNQWRVEKMQDREDSLQEARLIFWRCRVKYPDVEDKHLMALFKTAWGRHFIDLANKATDASFLVFDSSRGDSDDEAPKIDTAGDLDNDGMLVLMIKQAPREIQTVLSLFVSAPAELLELATEAWRRGGKKNAEGNRMINRCLGVPEDHDTIGNVRRYFLGHD